MEPSVLTVPPWQRLQSVALARTPVWLTAAAGSRGSCHRSRREPFQAQVATEPVYPTPIVAPWQ